MAGPNSLSNVLTVRCNLDADPGQDAKQQLTIVAAHDSLWTMQYAAPAELPIETKVSPITCAAGCTDDNPPLTVSRARNEPKSCKRVGRGSVSSLQLFGSARAVAARRQEQQGPTPWRCWLHRCATGCTDCPTGKGPTPWRCWLHRCAAGCTDCPSGKGSVYALPRTAAMRVIYNNCKPAHRP